MIKLIVHLIVFTTGAGLGIWWGVNHPSQAAIVAAQEVNETQMVRDAVQSRVSLLEKVISGTKPDDPKNAEYQQMLEDEKRKLQASPAPPPGS